MAEKYQSRAKKFTRQFEVVGNRQLAVHLPLPLHRLGVGELLRRSLATTNPIETCLSTVERVARNVKHWHAGNQALRWTATGLLEAERKFRKVEGFSDLAALHRKLNSSLTQQSQVA